MSNKISYHQMTLREKAHHLRDVSYMTIKANVACEYWKKNSISNDQFMKERVERMISDAFDLGMTDFLILMGKTFKLKLEEVEQQQNIEFKKLIK